MAFGARAASSVAASSAAALLLGMCAPFTSWAQPAAPEARKAHIRCAAVFGLAATTAKEQKAKDAYAGISMVLLVRASELDPSVPPKEALDAVTREFGDEAQRLAAERQKARESDATAREAFQQSYAQEFRRCNALVSEAAKSRQAR